MYICFMSRLFRLAVLFLVVVLAISTSRNSFAEIAGPAYQHGEKSSSSTFLSEKDQQAFYLLRSVESVSSTVVHFPVPDSKLNSGTSGCLPLSAERRLEQLAMQYALQAGEFSFSFIIREILYPFHFFW